MTSLPTSLSPSLQKTVDETKVDYVQLGSSGLRVSWPILGCMSFGSPELIPFILAEEESLKILKAAWDNGINTWDTANVYSNGISEEIIGKAIKKFEIPRHKINILTKICIYVGEDQETFGPMHGQIMAKTREYVNQGGLSRAAIFNAVDATLARLGTSYIDVLQIHRFDYDTPSEETMKALHDLVQSGKVRYLGASSMWATQFQKLQYVAERNGWTKFISMQNIYHLGYREEEREMNRFCKETGVGLIPYAPLGGGLFARPWGVQESLRSKSQSPVAAKITDADEVIVNRAEEIANEHGWKIADVAFLWHKAKGTIPVAGLNSVARVEEAAQLRGKSLTDEEVAYIEEPYAPKAIVGHF